MSDDTVIEYCIRCDQPGRADEMWPLYRFPEPEEEPSLWVHARCADAWARAALRAHMAAAAEGMREMVQTEGSGGVVDLERIRAASELADLSTKVVAASSRWEAARAELERLGINPDDIPP